MLQMGTNIMANQVKRQDTNTQLFKTRGSGEPVSLT